MPTITNLKEIPGYPGYYLDTHGTLYSDHAYDNKDRGIHTLKYSISRKGYYRTCLTVNHKKYTAEIHRLMAITFLDNPNNYSVVNHKDGNKLNNELNNLEWCTQKHNVREARRLGLVPNTHVGRPVYVEDIVFPKLKDAAEYLGCSSGTLCSALRANRKYKGVSVGYVNN